MMKMKRHSSLRLIGALACLAAGIAGCDQRSPLAPSTSTDGLAPLAAGAPGGLGAPSSLTSTAVSPSQIDLGWQDNSSKESGFEVQRWTTGPADTFTVLTTTGANVTSYSNTGLDPLTQYCYKVRAFRTGGSKTSYSDFSATSCATTPGPPPAPSNANARPASSSAVDVSWADNSANEDGFRVEGSAASTGPWEAVATTGANVTTYTDGGRSSEQQACYRVIAFNAHGASGPSNADCTAPPAGPTSLTATTVAQGIDLVWTDNSGVEGGYELQRSEDGVTFGTIADLAANATNYHDGGATSSSTTYWYRVRAKKDGGSSDFSNPASAQGGCVPAGPTEICGNGVEDDDCDGMPEGFDEDCVLFCNLALGYGCPPGYACNGDVCEPACSDGLWNGDESDVDCGGSCGDCENGRQCYGNADCASAKCVGGICQP